MLRRPLESKVRKEDADARMAEIQVVHAELDLLKELKDMGVVLVQDDDGNLTMIPARLDPTKAVLSTEAQRAREC